MIKRTLESTERKMISRKMSRVINALVDYDGLSIRSSLFRELMSLRQLLYWIGVVDIDEELAEDRRIAERKKRRKHAQS